MEQRRTVWNALLFCEQIPFSARPNLSSKISLKNHMKNHTQIFDKIILNNFFSCFSLDKILWNYV